MTSQKYQLSAHARERMEEWEISQSVLEQTLAMPEGKVYDSYGVYFYQRGFMWKTGKRHLIRVLVDETQVPMKVITLYHTSQYKRYEQ
jgi:hypothetical protein